ncbi:MAG: TRAP transporter small permease [Pseudomonadota bacterium]
MSWSDKMVKASEAVSRLAVWVGGISILFVTLLISAEIILRKFFGISTGGIDEISGYALAISFSWALSYTLLRRAHIRIDAIYNRLPNTFRPFLDCLSIASMSVFALVLTFFSFMVVVDTVELGARSTTTLETPLWIPQVLWLGGFILFSFNCCLLTFAGVASLFDRDFERVRELIGSRTTDEEIASETPKMQNEI